MMKMRGVYTLEHYRDGKLLATLELENGIVDVGANNLLDVMFGGATVTDPWYIGLIDTGATLAVADTMASHAGWMEFIAYTEATRQAWDEATAAARAITNSTDTEFTINAAGTVYGIFLVSDSAKSGVAGTLWSTAAYTAGLVVANLDVLKVTYTLTVG